MPDLSLAVFDQARELIQKASSILIISHKSPDGDAIGANLALQEALIRLGKHTVSACIDPVPSNCLFLNNSFSFVQDFEVKDFDLVITVDCGGHKLIGFQEKKPELLDRTKVTLLNIDHHPSNDHFGNINLVMSDTPSTCFILFLMFTYYGWDISPTMATSLLHGLYYDTGSLMHSNTTADTLRIVGRLKAKGADHARSIKEQFHTASIPKLKLWGRALARATLNSKNAVVSVITKNDYTETNTNHEDTSGLINYLNHVPNAKFCMLLAETENEQIKGSLRTQDQNIDLSRIAELFGGGGHKKASGFTINGRLVEKRTWGVI
ncbi:MAG: bifunctional oligoribonuclease/PAP phosphatase NrnA [Candidatus Gracilibacteria bacterium]